jgi:hypothetical protein
MSTLIDFGLSTEVIEFATSPSAAQNTQSVNGSSLPQTTMVATGRFCVSNTLRPSGLTRLTGFPQCGHPASPQNLGGTAVTTKTLADKRDDVVVQTRTDSSASQTVITSNSVLPVTQRSATSIYEGVGPIRISFELRSPNGFMSYLGSWYNYADRIKFPPYDSIPALTVFENGSEYLSISNDSSGPCYSSISYGGQEYCVPAGASHTTMLMDIAVTLRNLNVQPSDLNSPFTVRLAE